jgi:ATP-dependent Clp endopeptidase proteolytic subunit ClpP
MINRIKEKIKSIISVDSGGDLDKKIIVLTTGDQKPDLDLRIMGLFGDVGEEKVSEMFTALLYMNELNKAAKEEKEKKDIEFYVSTRGGAADDMFGLYDVMKKVEKESDIVTIGMGKVMSAGVLILAAGTNGKRQIGKNCRVMIHSVAAGNHGELAHMVNELEEIKVIQSMYIKCLSAETNMTEISLKNMLDRGTNVYLSAEEAVEYGIADIII